MSAYRKPLPVIDDRNRPYWEALSRREVRLPRCRACDALRSPNFGRCPRCGSEDADWERMSGRGTVWSATRFHQIYFDGFRDEVPYTVMVVELDEGPKVYANLVEAGTVAIGTRVEAVFDDVTPEVTLLKFRPMTAV